MPAPHPYFRTPARVARLQAAAAAWEGTPFRWGSEARGARGGVDCVRLVAVLMHESGAAPHFALPTGRIERTSLDAPSPFVPWLEGAVDDPQSAEMARRFVRLPEDAEVQAGDLVHYAAGRFWHLCVVLDAHRVISCVQGPGVHTNQLADPTYAERVVAVFRPVESQKGGGQP